MHPNTQVGILLMAFPPDPADLLLQLQHMQQLLAVH
jgi:hypothetical protein